MASSGCLTCCWDVLKRKPWHIQPKHSVSQFMNIVSFPSAMHDYTGVPVLWSQRLFYFQGDKTTSSSVSDCSRISTLWQLSLTMLQEPQLLPHPQMLCLSYSLYSICSGPFPLWKNDSSIKCDFRMFRKGTLMVPFPFFFL